MTTATETQPTTTDRERVLFTPYIPGANAANPLRAYMQISKADKARFDELPKDTSDQTVEVFDTVSQQSYIVRRASCGGSCYCAAEIVKKGSRTDMSQEVFMYCAFHGQWDDCFAYSERLEAEMREYDRLNLDNAAGIEIWPDSERFNNRKQGT